MSCICLARAGAIRCANRAGAALRPRACETRAKQGPDTATGRPSPSLSPRTTHPSLSPRTERSGDPGPRRARSLPGGTGVSGSRIKSGTTSGEGRDDSLGSTGQPSPCRRGRLHPSPCRTPLPCHPGRRVSADPGPRRPGGWRPSCFAGICSHRGGPPRPVPPPATGRGWRGPGPRRAAAPPRTAAPARGSRPGS